MEKISGREGELIVKAARKTIRDYFDTKRVLIPDLPEDLNFNCGVFVTLKRHSKSGERLRGCIGYPEPIFPLPKALAKAAVSAAVADPRFSPVDEKELDLLVIEVSLLSAPRPLDVEKSRIPQLIQIGRDGLIVEKGINKGLLLPQVAVEERWDAEEFLAYACMKAGLPPDEWLDEGTRIWVFTARVFKELEPNGQVVEEPFGPGAK